MYMNFVFVQDLYYLLFQPLGCDANIKKNSNIVF